MQTTKSSSLVGFGFAILVLLAGKPAMSQERQDFPNDERSHLENQSADSHNHIIRERENVRDTATVKQVVTPAVKPKTEPKKKEEEPLSYNFLYYIIQKFKGSDVVD